MTSESLPRRRKPSGHPEISSFMTADKLNSYTLKDLTALAKKRGVAGWHDMRKDQLVRALLRLAQRAKAVAPKAVAPKTNGKKHAVAARVSKPAPARVNKPAASHPSKPAPAKTNG